ncbi:MAG: hypothetical protein EBQ80_03725 [Proteobacteria bacterium]|nr:hypothetical protein [Pseudomonadota bacterium]
MRKTKAPATSMQLLLGASTLLPVTTGAVDAQLHAHASFRPRVEVVFAKALKSSQTMAPQITTPLATTYQVTQSPTTLLVLVY